MALLESPALASSLPQGYEPIIMDGDRMQPAALIEDELIVALPFVPKHAQLAECGTLGRGSKPERAPS